MMLVLVPSSKPSETISSYQPGFPWCNSTAWAKFKKTALVGAEDFFLATYFGLGKLDRQELRRNHVKISRILTIG